MKEKICGIYKITNIKNNKFYIGKSVNIYKRWQEHCRIIDNCPIHKAIQKYGKNNFKFEIIEQCSQEELNDKEIYWIKYYNGYESFNCYNATRGGDGASHPIKLSHDELLQIISLLKENKKTIVEIANMFKVSTKTISDINNGHSRILENEKYPIRENKYDGHLTIQKKQYVPIYTKTGKEIQSYHSIQVAQYDLFQNLIEIYPSIREAARAIKCNPESIRKAIKSKTHKSCGFLWKII